MFFRDKSCLRLQHRTHDFLPKFTDISRPSMGQQCLPSFPVKADNITFQFIVRNLAEELRQRHDVLLTVTQRRNGYLEIVQTVQQVLTKTLLIDRLFQILVGSGNDTEENDEQG